MNTAVYPGTFDPITNGHLDVVRRARHFAGHVVVAVADNARKGPYFDLDERVEMVRSVVEAEGLEAVSVKSFSNLLVDFARQQQATLIIRGLRAVSDFEYEVQMAGMNHHLERGIETVFIAADQRYSFLSSSMVKEISKLGGDMSDFVHPLVNRRLVARRARD